MNEFKYLSLCRLSTENYLQLEQSLFEFADIVYMYDDWENKKKISTMQLANLHGSICSGIEEALKLILVNPQNDLINEFTIHIDTLAISNKHKKAIKKELKVGRLDNVKLKWILDFKNFRKTLNNFSPAVIFSKPPFQISFPKNFSRKGAKPKW